MTEDQWTAYVRGQDILSGPVWQAQANQDALRAQQQKLLDALALQSQGQGPNPAQMMLNQATQQNNQQNAGFIASQKGINPAMAARMAAQNAAQSNQTAAGQGALMGAQQQLAAQNQMQGLTGQMQQANLAQEGLGFGNINATRQAEASEFGAQQQANSNMLGGILGGIGGLATGIGSFVKKAEGGEIERPSLHGFLDEIVNGGPSYSHGGDVGSSLKAGGRVPGKPVVRGDSYKNDTVNAKLSPGEVVIPNSVMQSKDPAKNAAKFVAAVMAKKRMKNV